MNATQYLVKTAYYNKIKEKYGNHKQIMDFINSNDFSGKQNHFKNKMNEFLANDIITPKQHKELLHISGQGSKSSFKSERAAHKLTSKTSSTTSGNSTSSTTSGNSVLNWIKENKVKTGLGAGALTLAGGYGIYKARQNREGNRN